MSDMKLQMIVTGNNSGLNQMLQQSTAQVRRFTQGASGSFSQLQAHAGRVWGAIAGMSAGAKLIGIGAGIGSLKSVIDDNLAFERSLLKIKFNAQMTTRELAELRQMAMDLSKTSLNSPLEVVQMQLRLANAGLKMNDIRQLAPTVANAAQVFEAPAGEIADLVFDKITKSGITNARVPQMLDMLYYHATSGRFETMDMARQAPELLNAGALVGLNNEAGLNLMGALTQRMMRNATVQNPSEVSTMVKHGLSHITDPHYVKKLGKIGIDVPSYFDKKGHFKGEGGVDGILALTRAMIDKGLENPFKLGKAGFREQYTKTFWLEMMRSVKATDTDKDPNLLKMMERGKEAMNSGQLAANLATIKEANFGKIKAAEIEIQKAKVSGGAQAITGAAGSIAGTFSEHPAATAAAAVAATLAGKYLLGKLTGGKGGALGKLGAGVAAGVQPVFVTNWPGAPEKASARLQRLAEGAAGGSGAGTAAAAIGGGAVASAAAGAAIVATPGVIAYAAKTYFESDTGQAARAKGLDLEIARLEARVNAQKGPGYQDKDLIGQLEKRVKQMKAARAAILTGAALAPASPAKASLAIAPAQASRAMGQKDPGDAIKTGAAPAPAGPAKNLFGIDPAPASRAKVLNGEIAQLETRLAGQKSPGQQATQLATQLESQIAALKVDRDSILTKLEALANRPVEIHLDGQKIAESVNKSNGRDARRQ